MTGGGSEVSGAWLKRQAVVVAATYCGVASVWILMSDRLLGLLVRDTDELIRVSVFKGFGFVIVTTALLYLLLWRLVRRIEIAQVGAAREEAERKRGEAELRRANAIVQSTDDAVISKSIDGIITTWNPAAKATFGYSEEEVVGQEGRILLAVETEEEQPPRSYRVKQSETTLLRKDGTTFPASITSSPIWETDESGGKTLVGVGEIIRDIGERRRTELIAEGERRFAEALVEAMPGVFYLYNERGEFLRWNDDFEKVSGYSTDELKRMHPLDFFADAEKSLVEERISQVFKQGKGQVVADFVAKDGTTTPYFFTGKRFVLDGELCLLGVGVDISERRQAEELLQKSEERFRTTLDGILEGCQLIDFEWRYLYLNDAAAKHNRRANHELLGRRMLDVWPGIEESDIFRLLKRCLLSRNPGHEEVEFPFPDGSTGWFDVRAQPVPEGVFVLSIDISERKRAERALRELNEGLELKIQERTADLEVAKGRAEAADRLKSAFLATMSHELRTPLNSIIGFTGMILKELAGPLNSEQAKQLGMVQTSARHLLVLINDVLDISKIEAGQLDVRPSFFDLPAAITHVIDTVAPLAQKKGITLNVALPNDFGPVESDQRRVEQILLNLLNNGIKFTDRGSVTVTLSAREIAASDGADLNPWLRIDVTDTGMGIEPHDFDKLFQPFLQIDSGLQRRHEGTGLGLAICRRLAELLGGTIKARSVFGRGSTFSVDLPMKWSAS